MRCAHHAADRAAERFPHFSGMTHEEVRNALLRLARAAVPYGAGTHTTWNLRAVLDDGQVIILGMKRSDDGCPVVVTVIDEAQYAANFSMFTTRGYKPGRGRRLGRRR